MGLAAAQNCSGVSCADCMKLDEIMIQQQLELPIRCYVASKVHKPRLVASMLPTGKGRWLDSLLSEFVQDSERVSDTDGCLAVLTGWGTRKFLDMHGTP